MEVKNNFNESREKRGRVNRTVETVCERGEEELGGGGGGGGGVERDGGSKGGGSAGGGEGVALQASAKGRKSFAATFVMHAG